MKISSYIKNASWFATLGAVMLLSAQMGEARAQGICDRTTEVRTVIIAAISGNPACGDVTANQLADVNPIDGLTINSLDSVGDTLRVGDFAGLSGLSRLNLAGNFRLGSVALPAGLFNGLSALTTLDLSDNFNLGRLVALPAGLFNGLSALTTLDLSGNLFLGSSVALPAELFNGLRALTTLDLSGNLNLGNAVALPAELFNDLSALTTLDLSGNSDLGRRALPAGFFNGLSNLTTLDMSGNLALGNPVLPAGLFNGLNALTTLDLSGGLDLGKFFALPAGLFNGLSALTTLDLSGNENLDSADLPDGIFHDALNTLTNLRLDDNLRGMIRMSTVTSAIDAIGATNIIVTRTAPYTAVNVAYTAAYSSGAEDTHFTGETGALEFAAGQTSAIINVTSSGPPLNSAVTITLGALRLPADMRAVPNTANVAEIVAVDPTSNTHTLTVDTQGICSRTPEVRAAIIAVIPGNPACGNVTATRLADVNPVDGLTIDSLDSPGDTLQIGDFAGLSGLSRLNLVGNSRLGNVALPVGLFNGLRALTTLDLSDNDLGFVALPAGLFNGLRALTTLDLSGNSNLGGFRAALPAGLFNGLRALTTLDLSGNVSLGGSRPLPAGLFNGLSALTTLDLSGNPNLGNNRALPAGLFNGLRALTTLNLSGNDNLGNIALPAELFNGLSALTTLDLSDNLRLGSTALPAELFNGLSALTTLDLSDNFNLQSNDLSNGIFDDVLDTLTELQLDDRLEVTLAFSASTLSANILPNGRLNLVVTINPSLPFAVRVPYGTTFSGGADGNHFTGESGMLDFAAGNTDDQTITITAINAPLNSTITIALGTPVPGTIVGNTFTAITHATGAGEAIPAAVLREFLPVTSNNDRILTVGAPVATTPAPICFRTDDVEMAILTAIGGGVVCQDVTAEQLATVDPVSGLTIDSLDSSGKDTLQVDDFAGLSGLRRLNLAGNLRLGNVALPAGLFNGLSALTTLNLSDNIRLGSTALPAGLFNGLSALTTLDLSDNVNLGNPSLPAELFNDLSALTTLDLSGNSFLGNPALPAGLFNSLSDLTTLDLSDNSSLGFHALPAGLFNDLSALTTLDLSGNPNLTSLSAGLFNSLSDLTTLNLSGNENLDSADLPDGLFNGLDRLATLNLSGNPNLTSLPDGLLDDILDMLAGLQLDTGLRRTLGLSVNRNSLVKEGEVIFQFNVVTALEAGLGVRVPYTAEFGGGTADYFIGLSASGTMDIVPGMASTTLEVTALDDAPIGATATITLGMPSLLYDGNNDGSSDEVKSGGNPLTLTDPVFNLVRVDTGNDEQTITIREDAIRLRIRTFLEGALQ